MRPRSWVRHSRLPSGLLILLLSGPAVAADPAGSPALTPQQKERLQERDRYQEESKAFQREGKTAEAIAAAGKSLAITRDLLGEGHDDVVRSLEWLADLHEEREEFPAARQVLQEALAIKTKRFGDKNWQVIDARLALDRLDRWEHLDAEGRSRLREADHLHQQALALYHQEKYREALPPAQHALELRKQFLGESHPDYASCLNSLGVLYHEAGDAAQAEPLLRQALAIRQKALGEDHPDYAESLHDLARVYMDKGDFKTVSYGRLADYARAEPLYLRALEIRKSTLGDRHAAYAESLHDLAVLYRLKGDLARAEPLFRKALSIRRDVLGEKDPDYADTLNSLAVLYGQQGAYDRAEPLFRESLAIRQEVLGDKHPYSVTTLDNLAGLYMSMGDYARAEPLFRQVLQIRKEIHGDKHPNYAQSLVRLGWLYFSMHDYARAEPLLVQAMQIRQKALGADDPEYAGSLNGLAQLYNSMGNDGRAESLFRQALEVTKRAAGEKSFSYAQILDNLATLYRTRGDLDRAEPLYRQAREAFQEGGAARHPAYATLLLHLAMLYDTRGDRAKAEPLYREALEQTRATLELTATVQSERQQLTMAYSLRYYLDAYLSFSVRAGLNGESAYPYVLAWKGAIFAGQRRAHLARSRSELAGLFTDLQGVSTRLAARALAVPPAGEREAWQREVARLTEVKEGLEVELARRSAEFRSLQTEKQLTFQGLQKVLPADAALIDYLMYTHYSPPSKDKEKGQRELRLLAFVVRPGHPLGQVDLGPVQPIAEAIVRWRRAFGRRGKDDPAAELRQCLWQPLEGSLEDVATVLVSPDGVLARLPLPALPGRKPGTYLIEERALATVPVPRLLPEILASPRETRQPIPGADTDKPSLLLVGAVDFEADPGRTDTTLASRSADRGSGGRAGLHFGPLQATGDEVRAVRASFEGRFAGALVKELQGHQATEAALRQQAPLFRYLHLATHGFFAPEELRSVFGPATPGTADSGELGRGMLDRQGVRGIHPWLLSGLVLAGANRPAQPDQDDGILTSLEVAQLDLRKVDLAVLSACETGLGAVTTGEGLLGLQRAFQTAGARSVVASLWVVPDRGTQVLMQRFYENLWHKKMSKLEALRETQLWMLRQVARQPDLWRGLELLPEDKVPPEDGRLPPYYWAAFVLSGDWR